MTRQEIITKLVYLVLDQPDCWVCTDDYLLEKHGKTTDEMSDDELTDLLMEYHAKSNCESA